MCISVETVLNLMLYFCSWHRLAVSVKGDSVTLLVDCEVKGTLKLNRQPGSTFNLAGALVVGLQMTPDQYYEVSANIINPHFFVVPRNNVLRICYRSLKRH